MSKRVSICGLAFGWIVVLGQLAGATLPYEKYSAADGVSQDLYGFDVAIAGDVLAIGTPAGTARPGSVYLYDLATGLPTVELTSPAPESDDFFGFTVAVSGDTVLVGDPTNPYRATKLAGHIHAFEASSGDLIDSFVPDDSAAGDEFGFSVSVLGTQAVIGAPAGGAAPGSAYLFDLAAGSQLFKLTGSDTITGSDFGYSVAMSSDFAVVGAPGNYETLHKTVKGAAYVYDAKTGIQLRKLQPLDAANGDEFGWSVAVHGSLALIGAPAGGVGLGAAYVFDLATGTQLAKLTPTTRQAGDDFGYGVAIEGNRALVGSPGQNAIFGHAYLFDALSGDLLETLTPNDGASNDEYGNAVSLSGHRYVVGSPLNEAIVGTINSGAAYIYTGTGLCGDLDDDNDVDSADLGEFIGFWTGVAEPGTFSRTFAEGDCDGDGDVDSLDLLSFIGEWTGSLDAAAATTATDAELVYNSQTGEVILTTGPDGQILGFGLVSPTGSFLTEEATLPFADLGSNTDLVASQIGQTDLALVGVAGPLSLGKILPAGLDAQGLSEVLSFARVASQAGSLQSLSLVVVPEPTGLLWGLGWALGSLLISRNRRTFA